MMSDQSPPELTLPGVADEAITSTTTVRQELVDTAAKFLQNPRVLKTSLKEQQNFLQRKGLTDEEIRLACEKSGAYAYHDLQSRQPPTLPPPANFLPGHPYQNYGYAAPITVFDRIREVVHNVAIFSFVGYIVYKFYKKFIEPFLFGTRRKSIEDSIDELDENLRSSIEEVKVNLSSVKVEVDKIRQGSESSTQRQLSDLKSEIATVKGLLLSRNQFPAPMTKSSVVRPSIPAWQKTSISQDSDPDSDPERKSEELLEIGSGSGSSEHETNTKNSDSSLEIISYSSSKECDSDVQSHKSKDFDKE